MIRYLSFDLQGVLSNADFSDYFWLEQLPRLYAKKHNVTLQEAKAALRSQFAAIGKYGILYYDDASWGRQLGFVTADILPAMPLQPTLNTTLLQFIKAQPIPAVILSTTTMAFINYELGDKTQLFQEIFSCVDTFRAGGKKPAVFRKAVEALGVRPDEVLHIGDNPEMDIRNGCDAGLQTIAYQGSAAQTIDDITFALRAGAPRP
jgi:FMN phosphatase YigB (HAD superfamily)